MVRCLRGHFRDRSRACCSSMTILRYDQRITLIRWKLERMSTAKERAIEGRTDLSRFVVHLTRDDTNDFGDDGASAAENFRAIVKDQTIYSFQPHCLYSDQIPEKYENKFCVCCFTEIPLTELHLLTRHIKGRRIQLSEYGIVFSREFLISKGAQPAIYINSYHENMWLREAADRIWEIAKRNDFRDRKLWRIVPFLNAMHERYDFTWEREWRIWGDLSFAPEDIVCVTLPEQGEEMLRREFLGLGVPVISPGWNTERIVSEFSNQARQAKREWISAKKEKRRQKRKKRDNR